MISPVSSSEAVRIRSSRKVRIACRVSHHAVRTPSTIDIGRTVRSVETPSASV
jgi:hypothetical protein